MDSTAQMVDGLLLNMLSRMRVQSTLPEEQRLFYFHIFESILLRLGAPSITELFRLGGLRV
jgi:hypothetical protein